MGKEVSSGKWTGIVEQVQLHEVLIGVGAFPLDLKRSQVVHHTAAIDYVGYTFMYDRPRVKNRATLWTRPFTKLVRKIYFPSTRNKNPKHRV